MKILVSQAILASSLILGVAYQAFAEGNCPPGYCPIGGQGARGCAPIPGAASGSGTTAEIQLASPTGKWVRTWGGGDSVFQEHSRCRSVDGKESQRAGRAGGSFQVCIGRRA